ncbi:uncharacterized protein ACA1_113830 [Acanthamoeba castellanii str. Neff]|uniref:Tyrosine specific protein phosphatases domain-containing protein n=1 Tax=Acanthamoeba castellanii (strain ATCC 30010 / Neff) TaxID=1257118 RepID=L8H4A5_ACACF|nr:uncharacterized protein ACA1_113830 [Acanthamoeba castellanii str. Neff]ELR20037.1 hypothetical protein ACA1_113830 [Acanthamoeba castellanii str. Neff]
MPPPPPHQQLAAIARSHLSASTTETTRAGRRPTWPSPSRRCCCSLGPKAQPRPPPRARTPALAELTTTRSSSSTTRARSSTVSTSASTSTSTRSRSYGSSSSSRSRTSTVNVRTRPGARGERTGAAAHDPAGPLVARRHRAGLPLLLLRRAARSPASPAAALRKEAKSNPFEVAHFPPPRLYGSSRLSSALPPGSPCPAAAADVDVGHRRETRAEGNTKTDEEEQLPDFPFPVSPPDTWALMRSLEQLYRDGRTAINRDTIVGRKLYNFRDLSEATQSAKHGVKVASQRIFRSACLSRGDVDHVDVVKSLLYLKEFVQVKTMIDFRNKDERMSDPLDPVVDAVYPRIKKGTFMDPYNIPLMNKSFKIMGLFLPSKWGTKMNMVKAVVYGSEKTPTEIFAEEAMNPMGLLGLNKLMLVYGKEEIAQVLRICANSSNYPIMYHCSSGKDRTGLITALILLCCGVDAQDIITNYHQSEIFLSPVMDRITAENQAKGLNAGFDGTPPEVMEQTIGYIFEKWGSITGYFSYIGFGSRDQMKLVQHLAHNSRK